MDAFIENAVGAKTRSRFDDLEVLEELDQSSASSLLEPACLTWVIVAIVLRRRCAQGQRRYHKIREKM